MGKGYIYCSAATVAPQIRSLFAHATPFCEKSGFASRACANPTHHRPPAFTNRRWMLEGFSEIIPGSV